MIETKDDTARKAARLLGWNIINPIVYCLDYWVFKKTNQEDGNYYQGDVKGLEHYSDEKTANGFAVLMTGLAIYQEYRFVKTQNWAPAWINNQKVELDLRSCTGRGAVLLIQIDF